MFHIMDESAPLCVLDARVTVPSSVPPFDPFSMLGRVLLGWCEGPKRQRNAQFLGPEGGLAVRLVALLVKTEVLFAVSRTVGF